MIMDKRKYLRSFGWTRLASISLGIIPSDSLILYSVLLLPACHRQHRYFRLVTLTFGVQVIVYK